MPKRTLKGIILSDKMKDTVTVKVISMKEHSKYKKRFTRSKKYKAHAKDELGLKQGDEVLIQECRPISKDKRWKVITQK